MDSSLSHQGDAKHQTTPQSEKVVKFSVCVNVLIFLL